MKKQEFIHVHGLLAEIADNCEENGASLDLERYDTLGTRPTSIHQSKTDHKDAVFALTDAITSSVDPAPVETGEERPASAD